MANSMRAMVLEQQGQALRLQTLAKPVPEPQQLLLKVSACGICRTDLHVVDGDLQYPKPVLIPGHQIVGYIEAIGESVQTLFPNKFQCGQRVGVPWLGGSCGHCEFCRIEKENLCDNAVYTGYQLDGGFAEYTVADASYCFSIPEGYSDVQAAPLLCAGLIGYRAYRLVEHAETLGLYGFGAAAHILIQVARYQHKRVYALTRPGDVETQDFARQMGAHWAGDSSQCPPDLLDAAIIFAPEGELVPLALKALRKGGKLVCAGIHMSDIPAFAYDLLWGERSIESVANLTRRDGEQFLPLAARVPVHTKVSCYSLEDANNALDDLRQGRLTGAAVLKIL